MPTCRTLDLDYAAFALTLGASLVEVTWDAAVRKCVIVLDTGSLAPETAATELRAYSDRLAAGLGTSGLGVLFRGSPFRHYARHYASLRRAVFAHRQQVAP